MLYGYFTLGVALVISAIAAYYSIVGLATLFAAALIPVIIMGAALEVGKITAAVWLKLNWARASLTYKLYLIPAVAILMFLTSMGIFGFLSKAHLDQASNTQESQAQIQRLDAEIARRTDIVRRAETKIKELESTGTGQDAQTQNQIDREQTRIDAALKRIEPAIQEQNSIISGQLKVYQDQLEKIDNDLQRLQNSLDKNDIAAAQAMVGVQPDGRIGPRTQAAFKEYRDRLTAQRQELINTIERSNNNPAIQAARREIQRIRATVEVQINESNQLINRLRAQVGKGPAQNIDGLIDEQQIRIKTANQELEQFIDQKYKLESEFRKLEAEVGPVKYLAELIYGDNPDKSLLEKAVRIVILIIVVVFDPLALVLILAAQQSLRWAKESPSTKENNKDIQETPQTDNKVEQTFDISKHAYLTQPWVSIPSGPPIVANVAAKEPELCNLCSSELVNGNELGMKCSNVDCTSYSINLNENDFIKPEANVTITSMVTADRLLSIDNNEIKEIKTDQLHIVETDNFDTSDEEIAKLLATTDRLLENLNETQKYIEAKRPYKAPNPTVPETTDHYKAPTIIVPEAINVRKNQDKS